MMVWDKNNTTGVTVTVPDQAALLEDLGRLCQAGKGFSVATLNLDHVVKLSRNPEFLTAYKAHTHVTADGNPIVWLSRLAGQPVSLVPGSGLIDPLMELAAAHDIPVAFFGARQDTLEAAAAELSRRHPPLNVVLCHAPSEGFDPDGAEASACLSALAASRARLCLVALGAPKQEIFVARAQAQMAGMGFVSIGAGLDFVAGAQRRAPKWVQRVAMEWLWRLAENPGRLAGRYAACFVALPGLASRALRTRYQSRLVDPR